VWCCCCCCLCILCVCVQQLCSAFLLPLQPTSRTTTCCCLLLLTESSTSAPSSPPSFCCCSTTMKVSVLVFVALLSTALCASSVLAATISPWAAVWTDSRHAGQIITCVEGSNIWGIYSNGVGYLQGNISSDGTVASGHWYEAGHVDSNTGTFTWTLTTAQTGFSGLRQTQYYRCAPTVWAETKIAASGTPTREQCLRLYDNSMCYSCLLVSPILLQRQLPLFVVVAVVVFVVVVVARKSTSQNHIFMTLNDVID
jgi:hypothetical protein